MSEIKNDLRSVAIVMFPDGNYLFLTPAGNIPDFKDAIDEKNLQDQRNLKLHYLCALIC